MSTWYLIVNGSEHVTSTMFTGYVSGSNVTESQLAWPAQVIVRITGFTTTSSPFPVGKTWFMNFLPSSSVLYDMSPPLAFALYALKNPAGHTHPLALVAFSVAVLCRGHATQPPIILSGKVPGGHPVQAVAPTALLVPSGHFRHPDMEVIPSVCEYFPAGHPLHWFCADALVVDE